jgi:hypothetical protein
LGGLVREEDAMVPGITAPEPVVAGGASERQPMTIVWALVSVILVVLFLTLGEAGRSILLRAVLVLTAVGEALAFFSNAFRPRQFAEQNGRPYHSAFHGVMQDFGFYNLAFAGLLVLAALDPPGSRGLLGVLVASYLVHALTHVLRFFGFYFGGGHSIPTRPRALELRDGLQLLAPVLGMILFFPS